MKVLFLDDDPERHAAFARLVQREGWDAIHAHDYTEAYHALNAQVFDIVYLDRDLADHRPAVVRPVAAGYHVVLDGEHVVDHILDLPRRRRPKRAVVHSWNPDAGRRMRSRLRAAGIPTTYRPLGDPRCRSCGDLISRHRGDNRLTLECP